MEAIAAFGLACNVIQVVSFGLEVASKSKEIQQKGSTIEVQDYEDTSKELADVINALDSSIKNAPSPLTKDDHDLQALSRNCSKAATDLQAELQKLSARNQRRRGTLSKTLITLTRGGAIQGLHKRLREYERVLNTRLLVRLSQQYDAHAIAQQRDFASLDRTLQDFVIRLSQGFTQISGLVSREHLATRELIHSEHAETRGIVLSRLQSLHIKTTAHDDCRSFLRSLYFPEIDARQESLTDAHRQTFEWIFDDSDEAMFPWHNFVDWLKCGNSIYWVNGKAGSGKSTLMNFICNDERTQAYLGQWKHEEIVVLNFFFWKAGTILQKSLSGLLRSLLHQILHRDEHLLKSVLATYPDLKLKDFNVVWSPRRLGEIFKSTMDLVKRPLCIFLDGLDEFDEEEDYLIGLIQSLSVKSSVKICTSSRPSSHLHSVFKDFPQLRLQDLTKHDLKIYVDDFLQKSANPVYKSQGDDRRASELAEKVVGKAEGVFLWVRLALKTILKGLKQEDSWIELCRRLEVLPKGLEELYSHMWSRLNEDEPIYRMEAALWFRLVLLAQQILYFSPSLFEIMIATNPDEQTEILTSEITPALRPLVGKCELIKRRIPTLCAGLLEVRENVSREEDLRFENFRPSNPLFDDVTKSTQSLAWRELKLIHQSTTVSFIHRSATDFLQETKQGQMLLGPENMPDIEICVNLLRAALVPQMLHFQSLHPYATNVHFSHLTGLMGTLGLCSGTLKYDILDMFNTVYERMFSRFSDLPTPGKWFQHPLSEIFEEFIPPEHFPTDFLGFVIQRGVSPSISKWAVTQIEGADIIYKNYLLAHAVRNIVNYDTIRFLLEGGANPNTKQIFEPYSGLRTEVSSWNYFLQYHRMFDFGNWDRRPWNAIIETFLCFVDHGASLEEVMTVISGWQQSYFEGEWHENDVIATMKDQDIVLATFTPCFIFKDTLRELGNNLESFSPCCRSTVFRGSDGLWLRPENEEDSERLFKLVKPTFHHRIDGDSRTNSFWNDDLEALRGQLIPIEPEEVLKYIGWDRARSEAEQRAFLRLFSQDPDISGSEDEAGWETADEEVIDDERRAGNSLNPT